jgi:hypothetical protein
MNESTMDEIIAITTNSTENHESTVFISMQKKEGPVVGFMFFRRPSSGRGRPLAPQAMFDRLQSLSSTILFGGFTIVVDA